MKRRKIILLIALPLAVCLLAGAALLAVTHRDSVYRFLRSLRRPAAPAIAEAEVEGNTVALSDLCADPRVTVSDTLLLVNHAHPLPADFSPALTEYNGCRMNPAMPEAYASLRDAVEEKTGIRLYVTSDYRTAEEQAETGNEVEEGIAAAPGESEHETGLALDVCAKGYGGMSFLQSPAGRETNDVAWEYGFIIRYPDGKKEITGFDYEPWHLRYVGAPHAEIIAKSGLTLEEYIDLYAPGVWYAHGDYRILRFAGDSVTLPEEFVSATLSRDNTGYRILTIKLS